MHHCGIVTHVSEIGAPDLIVIEASELNKTLNRSENAQAMATLAFQVHIYLLELYMYNLFHEINTDSL